MSNRVDKLAKIIYYELNYANTYQSGKRVFTLGNSATRLYSQYERK